MSCVISFQTFQCDYFIEIIMDSCLHTLAPMDKCCWAKSGFKLSFLIPPKHHGKKVSKVVDNRTYSYSFKQDIQSLYSSLSLQLRVSPLFPNKWLNSWMRIGWRLPFSLPIDSDWVEADWLVIRASMCQCGLYPSSSILLNSFTGRPPAPFTACHSF